jgi:hypothetical protein
MARYSAGAVCLGVNTANSVVSHLRNLASVERLYIVKIAISILVAPTTGPSFFITRTTSAGTTPTVTLIGQASDPADTAANGNVDGATWATPPTITAANKIDVGGAGTTPGGAFLWTFYDKPLVVPTGAANGVGIVNANAAGATVGSFLAAFTWDE